MNNQLGRLVSQSDDNSSLAVGIGVAAAAAVVVVLHWLQAVGLGSGNALLAALSVGISVILTVACGGLLLWSFWRTRLDPNQTGYTLAVVFSIATICIGLEAFAGTTTLLWQRGMIRAANSDAPSLWRGEGHYLWHLLNSVPLISAPRTMGWRDPQPFTGHTSGALVLAFKIAIIAPLIRLGLSGYQFFEARRVQVIAKRKLVYQTEIEIATGRKEKMTQWRGLRGGPSIWNISAFLTTVLIAGIVALAFLFNPESSANHWLNKRFKLGLNIGHIHLPLVWLHGVPQWVVVAALIYVIGVLRQIISVYTEFDTVGSVSSAIGSILIYFWILALLTLTAAAISLALLHVGVAITRPEIPPGSQPSAGVNAYAWAIADALPGPNIPTTLNWPIHYRFVDHWSEALLLLYKIVFIAVLVFPLYRIVRIYTERSRPADAMPSPFAEIRQVFNLLQEVQAALDRHENSVHTADDPDDIMFNSLFPTQHSLANLKLALDNLQSQFGHGDVSSRARAAQDAAVDRFHAINRPRSSMNDDLTEKRIAFDQRVLDLSRSVKKAFRDAASTESFKRG